METENSMMSPRARAGALIAFSRREMEVMAESLAAGKYLGLSRGHKFRATQYRIGRKLEQAIICGERHGRNAARMAPEARCGAGGDK